MTGGASSFSSNQPAFQFAAESSPSSTSFDYKRPFDTAFYPSAPATSDGPPPTLPYQPGWTNNRGGGGGGGGGGYSNSFRGGSADGYNRFPKRSRPYRYQN